MDGAADARAAAGCSLTAEIVSAFGEVCLRVTGSSMLPSVWPGDVLTVCRAEAAQVLPGEIVLVARDGSLLAHRVIGKTQRFLITRGDNLSLNDPPVSGNELLGRVTSILRGGRRITPRPYLNFYERVLSFILRHSDRATSLSLRLHALRMEPQMNTDAHRSVFIGVHRWFNQGSIFWER